MRYDTFVQFDHIEDQAFFAELLCDGDEDVFETRFSHCFDFRDPRVKRAEFDVQKIKLKALILERYGRKCMLQYPGICEGSTKLLLDHFIPLSSNVLNKTLRHISSEKGRKVKTQSFGSNHPDNFVLACPRCNAFKKHRMPDAELLARATAAKSFIASSDVPICFTPNDEEMFTLSNGEKIVIQKCCTSFPAWKGAMPENTYGGKQVLDCDGQPAFAELVVLWTLQKEGWQGVWVDTYGKKYRVGLPRTVEPVTLPSEQTKLIEDITACAGSLKGCWDVFLWKGSNLLFVELKRKGKDAIRETQVRWLEASLAAGISPKDFLFVEWEPVN